MAECVKVTKKGVEMKIIFYRAFSHLLHLAVTRSPMRYGACVYRVTGAAASAASLHIAAKFVG